MQIYNSGERHLERRIDQQGNILFLKKTPEQDLIKEVGIKSAADVLGLVELITLRTNCG